MYTAPRKISKTNYVFSIAYYKPQQNDVSFGTASPEATAILIRLSISPV